ncbi:MAG TPA: TIGR03085 family metal-binding protein [Dermatophilaceae bacterium]|nr:TIGR03085 family metal-binding protein [Dermatophilaceae bacterium]
MTRFASSERQGLCDTFELVGPDAPTLCSPWLTRDLAAHLVVRERRPDVAAGILVPFLAGRLEKVQNGYAAWEWPRLVSEVRTGPPIWSPASLGPVDEAMNTAEFFVHHEDVLRGGPQWSARKIAADLESALWGIVGRVARLQLARSRVGVVLVAPSYGERQVHAKTDLGTVKLTGTPGELLLYAFGRRDQAQVDLSGSDEALTAI